MLQNILGEMFFVLRCLSRKLESSMGIPQVLKCVYSTCFTLFGTNPGSSARQTDILVCMEQLAKDLSSKFEVEEQDFAHCQVQDVWNGGCKNGQQEQRMNSDVDNEKDPTFVATENRKDLSYQILSCLEHGCPVLLEVCNTVVNAVLCQFCFWHLFGKLLDVMATLV